MNLWINKRNASRINIRNLFHRHESVFRLFSSFIFKVLQVLRKMNFFYIFRISSLRLLNDDAPKFKTFKYLCRSPNKQLSQYLPHLTLQRSDVAPILQAPSVARASRFVAVASKVELSSGTSYSHANIMLSRSLENRLSISIVRNTISRGKPNSRAACSARSV